MTLPGFKMFCGSRLRFNCRIKAISLAERESGS